jgi:predicted negative regulator of RcsB-dependent stress response
VARYKKKRARELQHDAFRDKTMGVVDRLGEKLEGKGKTILYVLCAIVAIALIFWVWSWRSNRKAQEAYRALGRAIEINSASVGSSPTPGATGPTYATDKDRAENAIREFQAVSAKYSSPYRDKANYFIAANKLSIPDKRNEGISELEALGKSSDEEIATMSKFALAQAREEDGQYDAAATIYSELAQKNSALLSADTVNLRLANVMEKQGKNKEAVEVLFKIVESARKAKDSDGKPLAQSSAARDAATKLEKLDSARFAQLPAEDPSMDLPM